MQKCLLHAQYVLKQHKKNYIVCLEPSQNPGENMNIFSFYLGFRVSCHLCVTQCFGAPIPNCRNTPHVCLA